MIGQLFKKFAAYNGTRRFITVLKEISVKCLDHRDIHFVSADRKRVMMKVMATGERL
jgi:hypothetical protein